MKSKGTKGCSKFLKLNLAAQIKSRQIPKEVQMYFLKTGAMTLPVQAI
jgi:hypothetical protein